ncbi:MAG: hypothetical protein A2521_03335 [Deltaproteobacteria bacterium RIFOXYD12_FULL_57_12]|nr:MAG: hypothetical protein A2521_03335 [Deltaproteobacteria bacterium RIFOXYD12_FULL_57_12]
MDTKVRLREFLQALLAEYGEGPDFEDDDSLVLSGLLDSQAVLRIVVFLEDEFGLDLAAHGFDQNEFDSLTGIMGIIGRE